MTESILSKNQIRQEISRIRNSLSESEIVHSSNIINSKVISTKEFKNARSIGIYYPIRSEVKTFEIIKHSLATKKTIGLPRIIDSKRIAFFKIMEKSLEEIKLTKGKYGILENVISDFILEEMDLLIIPGIAFDLQGNRIGYGKGYYDRFLSSRKVNYIIGLAFENQIIKKIPYTEYDIPVDLLFTEKRTIYGNSF
ncbi:MAG TPA: 5-formyltetrahydrofolate cyclo-ligase [Nitrososphaeraceae archaeon]|nr:5-formyltetrahydrofolate cyclo-ligase [Nitrososphaeraceae archaeon]